MNINGTLIKTEEIIGISEIFARASKNDTNRMLYGEYFTFYYIITKSRNIEIISEAIQNMNLEPEELHTYKEISLNFRRQYFKYRKEIGKLIGEPIEVQNEFDNELNDQLA